MSTEAKLDELAARLRENPRALENIVSRYFGHHLLMPLLRAEMILREVKERLREDPEACEMFEQRLKQKVDRETAEAKAKLAEFIEILNTRSHEE